MGLLAAGNPGRAVLIWSYWHGEPNVAKAWCENAFRILDAFPILKSVKIDPFYREFRPILDLFLRNNRKRIVEP